MSSEIKRAYQDLKSEFHTSRGGSISERKELLRAIRKWIKANEQLIFEALNNDLGKPKEEVQIFEIKPIISEIDYFLRNLYNLTSPKKQPTPFPLIGMKSFTARQPKGICLIISPWNFPFQLAINPIIAAIAAGNLCVIKPSEHTSKTSSLLKTMFLDLMPSVVKVVEGGIPETTELLKLKWDHIFFTGSPKVGSIIMKAASQTLTPITLELGGANPLIIDSSSNITEAAKKIVWGKFYNCGQSCISINHIFAEKSIYDKLTSALKREINNKYGELNQIHTNKDYGKIINKTHYDRLTNLLNSEQESGYSETVGNTHFNEESLTIAPTLVEVKSLDSMLLKQEIFGPILPIYAFEKFEDILEIINHNPPALAMYYFGSKGKSISDLENKTQSGALSINETTVHFINPNLPFGGIGQSGLGSSHAQYGFNEFSYERAILKHKKGKGIVSLIHPPYTSTTSKLIDLITWKL